MPKLRHLVPTRAWTDSGGSGTNLEAVEQRMVFLEEMFLAWSGQRSRNIMGMRGLGSLARGAGADEGPPPTSAGAQ